MIHNFDDDLTETAYNTAPFYAKSGRIGRMRYLAYSAIWCGVILALLLLRAILANMLGNVIYVIFLIPVLVVLVYALFAPAMRRFNDLNRSSWWAVLMLLPVINLLTVFYLSFQEGTEEENDYGLPAEPPTPWIKILGGIWFAFGALWFLWYALS